MQFIRLLTHTANCSIRRISPCRSVQKALYRFLRNEKVSEEALITELCERSASLCAHRHVLCIQDSTEMNLISQSDRIKDKSGLGRLDHKIPQLGFKMHSSLMLDALTGDPLGFTHVKLWHRPVDMADRHQRNIDTLPVEQKESYKWIETAARTKELLKEADAITFIEDREGDFYAQLSSIAGPNIHYIIRSKINRPTIAGIKAWDVLAQQPPLGSITIKLNTDRRKKRLKRQVTLKLRYTSITLGRPWLKNAKDYPEKTILGIVEAYEEGGSQINWKLLTTHPVNTFGDAARIVEWYAQRWTIEQVHRLLKNKGFQLEDSELESGWSIRKLCILMLSALLRIIQMNIAYSEPEGGQPIEEVFSGEEIECLKHINRRIQGRTPKLSNNNDPSKLKWATWIIGRLGGWTGYDSQGAPGVIILKRGLDKFSAIYFGWQIAKDVGTQ